MSRTYKADPPRPYNKERKEHRKRTNQKARKQAKAQADLLAACPELWADCAPVEYPHTEGWETY